MQLNTTFDIETTDASATVNQIQTTLAETGYRLSVTDETVRVYARMGTDESSVSEDVETMLSELTALDDVEIDRDSIEIEGRV
jgi:transcriptional/translational regulatory protein YebC/TACO1